MSSRPKRAKTRSFYALPDAKWTVDEKKALVAAIKKYGVHDTEKLSEAVGTRRTNDVETFLHKFSKKLEKEMANSGHQMEPMNQFSHGFKSETSYPLKQWMRVIHFVASKREKNYDYDQVIVEVFKKIYESYPDTEDEPDLPSFKKIYLYLVEILSGNVPPTLSPCDSSILSSLHNDLASVIPLCSAEINFLKEFKGNVKFEADKTLTINEENDEQEGTKKLENAANGTNRKTVQVKKEKNDEDCDQKIIVPIPDHMYEHMLNHQSLMKKINPLSIPVWLTLSKTLALNR